MSLERIEEWIASQEPRLRSTLGKSTWASLAIAGPLLLVYLPPSPKWKIVLPCFYLMTLLCAWLASRLAIYRTKARLLEAEIAKEPELPRLDPLDHSMLIYLVAQNLGCGVDRIATYAGKASYEISHSMDKLEAHGFVTKTRDSTASGAEYKATPKGRDKCINPRKNA